MVQPDNREFLLKELAMAIQKHSTNVTAALTSASVGAALLALVVTQLPRPCTPQTTDGCVPQNWNLIYALGPVLPLLAASISLQATARMQALSVYITDIERNLNAAHQVTITTVDGYGIKQRRAIPSSEQMLAAVSVAGSQRFDLKPMYGIAGVCAIAILLTSATLPLAFLSSPLVRLIAAIVYGHLVFVTIRITYRIMFQPRRFTHELWASGLRAAETSRYRHSSTDSTTREFTRFIQFIIYPRPLVDHVVKLVMSAGGLFLALAVSPTGSLNLLRGFLAWMFIELVLYPVRYQINDIRDYNYDHSHPGKAGRKRTQFNMTRHRVIITATSQLYRAGIAIVIGIAVDLTVSEWLATLILTAAFITMTTFYETTKRSWRDHPKNVHAEASDGFRACRKLSVNGPNLTWRIRRYTFIALCGFGYVVRVEWVALAATSAIATLWPSYALVGVALMLVNYFILKNQWAVEGSIFASTKGPLIESDPAAAGQKSRPFQALVEIPIPCVSDELISRPHLLRCMADYRIVSRSHELDIGPVEVQKSLYRWAPRTIELVGGGVYSRSFCLLRLAIAFATLPVVFLPCAASPTDRIVAYIIFIGLFGLFEVISPIVERMRYAAGISSPTIPQPLDKCNSKGLQVAYLFLLSGSFLVFPLYMLAGLLVLGYSWQIIVLFVPLLLFAHLRVAQLGSYYDQVVIIPAYMTSIRLRMRRLPGRFFCALYGIPQSSRPTTERLVPSAPFDQLST